ncbi:unnamed protein product, partial [Prorocentrum cordatum]
ELLFPICLLWITLIIRVKPLMTMIVMPEHFKMNVVTLTQTWTNLALRRLRCDGGHVDLLHKEALQQLIDKEPEKRIVPTQEVAKSVGAELMNWKLAAEAELTGNFFGMGVIESWSDKPPPDQTMSLKTAVIEYPMMCPNLENDDPLWGDIFKLLHAKYSPDNFDRLPELHNKYGECKKDWYAMFVKANLLDNDTLRAVLGGVLQEQTSEVKDDQQVTAAIPESDEEEPAKKRRRGKKRCRPGANDRRAAKAQKAQDDSQRQSTAAAA